jgi:hypothetical protein
MKIFFLVISSVALCSTSAKAQGKTLTTDPLTALPLPSATDAMHHGNEPVKMPDGTICKSKMQGNFYDLYNYFAKQNAKTDEIVTWYSSHLPGFRKVHGYDGKRSQDAFYNANGTMVVIVTGNPGAATENTFAYAVAYERYQPGLSPATITSLTQGKIVCR